MGMLHQHHLWCLVPTQPILQSLSIGSNQTTMVVPILLVTMLNIAKFKTTRKKKNGSKSFSEQRILNTLSPVFPNTRNTNSRSLLSINKHAPKENLLTNHTSHMSFMLNQLLKLIAH